MNEHSDEDLVPSIDAMRDFLGAHQRSLLEELAVEYPEHAANLIPGQRKLGRENAVPFALRLTERALQLAMERSTKNLDYVRHRLKKAKGLRFGAALVSLLSSTGVLVSLNAQVPVRAVGALINLAAAVTILSANFLDTAPHGDGKLQDIFERLVSYGVQAEALARDIQVCIHDGASGKKCKDVMATANQLVASLSSIEKQLGTG